jgi:arylsulfatase
MGATVKLSTNTRFRQTAKLLLPAVLSVLLLRVVGCQESDRNGSASARPAPVQVTGVLGSPGATTTIPGTQLPPPDPKFGGVIKDNALQSKAWWAPRVVPPKQAPNVLLIMTDEDTPFSWTKQIASHFGGTRQGMCVSWPGHIKDVGGIRNQFHHVIDVVPTILEVSGIPQPQEVDGIKQSPIEGVSFAYTFDAANAIAPSRHHTQYFEMFGDHAIYSDGWIASTKVVRPPWELAGAGNPDPLNNVTWELYDLTKDWTQSDNVVAQNPARLSELKQLFLEEARKYQVLPLDSSVATRVVQPRPNITAGRSEFVYTTPITGVPQGDSPSLLNCSYVITADITVPEGGAEGMILTSGGRFAGYGFYLLKGKPVFLWNLFGLQRVRWDGPDALAPGKHALEFDFNYEGLGFGTLAFNNVSGIGRGGTGVLKVDGKVIATQKMEHTVPIILQFDETFDIGSDTGTPVCDEDYQVPFPLTAKLNKLTIKIDRPQLSPADIKRLEEEGQRNNHVTE